MGTKERDPDTRVDGKPTVLPGEHVGGRVRIEKPLPLEESDHAAADPFGERGEVALGERPKKVCVQCHRIQEDGGRIGPQLAGIGQRGFERLLEDIVDPNRNVDEAFRMTTVTTTGGNVFSGLKLRDEGGDIVLADTNGKEVRIAADEVEEVVLSRLSAMPSNTVDQIGETNLPDLLAYLMQASGLERNAVGAEGSR